MSRLNRIKVCLSVAVFGSVAVLATLDQRSVHAFSSGPPAGLTGAPGESNCTQCHTGSLNSGPGTFTIVGPASYEPGQTYQITVRHTTTDTTRRRWGFQLTALNAANNRAGNLQRINESTQIIDNDGPGGNRQYIEHTLSGSFPDQTSEASWTFNWVAPATDVGTVTFYAAGNQANNNGLNSGDQIYTTSLRVNGTAPAAGPKIVSASAGRKHLFIMAEGFTAESVLLINDVEQNTRPDELNPTTVLIGVKVIKKNRILPGQEVTLKVRNPGGVVSEGFTFRRPE